MHSYAKILKETEKAYFCLNPCFNGRCTRTYYVVADEQEAKTVLILVLMEDALVQGNIQSHCRL